MVYMGVTKNRDTPKWMVKIMEYYIPMKMDDLGGTPYFRKHPICSKGYYLENGNFMNRSTSSPIDIVFFREGKR